jgi:hypothetical protein
MARNLPLLEYYRSQGASLPDFPEGANERDGLAAIGNQCAVAGTPDDCIATIAHARDILGCEYLQLMNLGAGPGSGHRGNYESELAALELFGRDVLPAFR